MSAWLLWMCLSTAQWGLCLTPCGWGKDNFTRWQIFLYNYLFPKVLAFPCATALLSLAQTATHLFLSQSWGIFTGLLVPGREGACVLSLLPPWDGCNVARWRERSLCLGMSSYVIVLLDRFLWCSSSDWLQYNLISVMLKIYENHCHIGKGETQSSRTYVEGLGHFSLCIFMVALGFILYLQLICFLQYSFKPETRSELCEGGRKMYLNFINARFEVAFKHTSVSK